MPEWTHSTGAIYNISSLIRTQNPSRFESSQQENTRPEESGGWHRYNRETRPAWLVRMKKRGSVPVGLVFSFAWSSCTMRMIKTPSHRLQAAWEKRARTKPSLLPSSRATAPGTGLPPGSRGSWWGQCLGTDKREQFVLWCWLIYHTHVP